jgi:hypothetical protein
MVASQNASCIETVEIKTSCSLGIHQIVMLLMSLDVGPELELTMTSIVVGGSNNDSPRAEGI